MLSANPKSLILANRLRITKKRKIYLNRNPIWLILIIKLSIIIIHWSIISSVALTFNNLLKVVYSPFKGDLFF